MTRILASALAFLSLLAATAAPAAAANDEAGQAAVVERAVTQYIVPNYRQLAESASTLAGRIDRLCKEPDAKKLEDAQAGFRELLRAWAAVDFLRFGPMADGGRYERFAFWPDPRGIGQRQLRRMISEANPALLGEGALKSQSAAVQGLPALEVLLFEEPVTAAEGAFSCGLAAAVARNLAGIAAEARDGWLGETGWSRLMARPGPENAVYRSRAETLTELLKAELTGLEQTPDQRIRPALGDSPETARPRAAPYYRSGSTAEYWHATARALTSFAEKSEMMSLLPKEKSWIANSVAFEFDNLTRTLGALTPPVETILTDPAQRDKVSYALVVFSSLKNLFHDQYSPAVGLSPGFNALDGD
ncbi:imelysin family protein [Propylenella binzhouense]|uniref:Imelysin-like domain-containing protein n=1 Tax=Propylenella binzhouense TaxID=2555902 RepID=A0A964T660_9HYPH|nr:imelysin family protein [Propylenella binzhouense]MYZ49261.1 hypothetical protein [Propylenella binzhouense]